MLKAPASQGIAAQAAAMLAKIQAALLCLPHLVLAISWSTALTWASSCDLRPSAWSCRCAAHVSTNDLSTEHADRTSCGSHAAQACCCQVQPRELRRTWYALRFFSASRASSSSPLLTASSARLSQSSCGGSMLVPVSC